MASIIQKIGIASLLFTCLTGCWNRTEINDLSVVLAMGIDLTEQGNYEITVQVADPSQMSKNRGSERSPSIVFSSSAPTLFEALRKITTNAPRRMYIAHLRILILNDAIARKGIRETLDFLFRDHEIRPDFYMAVARGFKAKEILSIVTPMETLTAMDLYRSLKMSEKVWAPTAAVNVTDMIQRLTKDGWDPVLTGVTIVGDVKKGESSDNVKQPASLAEYKYTGIGLFRDERLVGWLNEQDSKGYSYITNKVSNTVGRVKCPDSDKLFLVEVHEAKTKYEPRVENGKPVMHLKVRIQANLGEVHCKADLTDENVIKQMEQLAKKQLEKIIMSSIASSQSKGTDVYGFGEAFHRKYPKLWRSWQQDWHDIFQNELKTDVSIDYTIRYFGKLTSPMHETIEEQRRR
ncbi:Ger(x)C family spore germination protein [Paenibacillus protaetiae]|uniref:Ger(X)C family spore germination protein n=1 Tax=Paenibacillus protaetiae TaxID=2509456 RepID=A0A4P6F637_9BACL|nr:Ger(x)C family spore germination protein [Paenibacillus protaetiae]QAY65858.1 Ger(x)C family spore germination protein [Paenibacillus protaetiae]